jgi:hypothetical protein
MVLLSFGDWWEGLTIFTKIYWMITIPASFIFIVQLVLSFRPKIEVASVNPIQSATTNEKAEISFQLISFRNCIGFLTSLGWSGLACIDAGISTASTILASFICGIMMMLAMAVIFYIMAKLMKTVEEDM